MTGYNDNPAVLGLKEWQVTVDALLRGDLAFMMRKGGIHEPANRFLHDTSKCWLFPTYEHQYEFVDEGDTLLKERWMSHLLESRQTHRSADEAERSGIGVHTPETILLEGYAETLAIHEFWTQTSVNALIDLGIWTPEFAVTRLKWKPRQPLVVFHLQAFRLDDPLSIPADQVPKRCYSWIETPFRVENYAGTPVECASSDGLKRLCSELSILPEETAARERARVEVGNKR
ncbi:MAG: DUF1802 family protein [Candidatus Poribacteria bacterium]|nr:DUF1802 family protein [Candidatus Poribacteria bacterium]